MATLNDISRETGLSLSTISHVLNGRPGFSAQTRDRVHAAARKLNYKPNLMARGLRGSRGTQMVGLVWSLGRPEAQMIIRMVGQRLWQQGYAMQMHESMSSDAMVLEALRDLNSRGVEAVVVQHYIGMLKNRDILKQLEKFKSVVLVSINITDGAISGPWDTIIQDAAPAVESLMDYWARTGRKRPALMGTRDLIERFEQPLTSFKKKLVEHGWSDEDFIIDKGTAGNFGQYVDSYIEAIDKQFHGRHFPYDAVLCVGDDGAGAMHYWLGENGYKVGQDVSVAGYVLNPITISLLRRLHPCSSRDWMTHPFHSRRKLSVHHFNGARRQGPLSEFAAGHSYQRGFSNADSSSRK
jgi:DNA-binding LacI/PurR family transcriptional regulator